MLSSDSRRPRPSPVDFQPAAPRAAEPFDEDALRYPWFGALRRTPVIGHAIRFVEIVVGIVCFIGFALDLDRDHDDPEGN